MINAVVELNERGLASPLAFALHCEAEFEVSPAGREFWIRSTFSTSTGRYPDVNSPCMTAPAPRQYVELGTLLSRIRTRIVDRGVVGIKGLGRLIKTADENGDGKIDLQNELPKFIGDIGIIVNRVELNELIRLLDRNGDGLITYKDFLNQLAPPLNESRLQWINKAFDKLDFRGAGKVSMRDILIVHNPKASESVKMGTTTANGLLANLLRSYDRDADGHISRNEFTDFYREVSPSISNDEAFGQMMKSAWKL
jgi:Ca2+-binding EF-hand superfamily protein